MKTTPTQRLLRNQHAVVSAQVRILGDTLRADTPDWAAVESDIAATIRALEEMRTRAETAGQ